MKKSKHIAIVLLILWIIIYLSTDLFFNILGCFESLVIETAFGTVHLFYFISSFLVLYPLLFVIHHHAQKAEMKKLCLLMLLLKIILTIWLLGILICIAVTLFVV